MKNNNKNTKKIKKNSTLWLYGKHSCLQAISNPNRTIHQILVTQNAKQLIPSSVSCNVIKVVSSPVFQQFLSPDAVHQGMAVEVSPLQQPDIMDIIHQNKQTNNSVLVLLDQVTDPHNIGAILRSSAAFGADAVILPDKHTPEETAIMAKSASGAMENTPLITVTNLARTIELLKEHDYWVMGLDGHTDQTIDSIPPSAKIAIILGAEGKGLRALTRKHCDFLVKLPIDSTRIESLNVSNAAAICLYEIHKSIKI